MSLINRICRTTILISIFGAFSLTPLLFTVSTSELFEFPKFIAITFFATIIATAWIIQMIYERRIIVSPSPLLLALLTLLFSSLLSTLTSIDPYMSLYGYYSRFHAGLIAMLSYAVIAIATATVMTRRIRWWLLLSILISTATISLWGILSHFGIDVSCLVIRGDLLQNCWAANFNPKDRIFATFGQANWLAGYLAMVAPLALTFFFLAKKARAKIITALFLLLFLIALLLTKSRGGYLGFGAGILVFSFLTNRKVFLALLAGIVLVSIISFSPLTARMDTILIRLSVWRGAWEIFLHHPILGTGVETFAPAFDFVRPRTHLQTPEWDFLYNKAHNEWLNILATTGILGFGSYVVFLGTALASLRKRMIPNHLDDRLLSVGILSALAAYVVQSFFGFSVVSQGVLFFTLPFLLQHHPEVPQKTHGILQKFLIIIVLIVGLFLSGKIFILFSADQAYTRAKSAATAGNVRSSLANYQEAIRLRPGEPTFLDDFAFTAAVAARYATTSTDREEWIHIARGAWQETVAISPNDPAHWKTGMQLFTRLADIDPKYTIDAIAAGRRAQTLSPNDPKLLLSLARLYMRIGNFGEARLLTKEAFTMKPDYPDSLRMLDEVNRHFSDL